MATGWRIRQIVTFEQYPGTGLYLVLAGSHNGLQANDLPERYVGSEQGVLSSA